MAASIPPIVSSALFICITAYLSLYPLFLSASILWWHSRTDWCWRLLYLLRPQSSPPDIDTSAVSTFSSRWRRIALIGLGWPRTRSHSQYFPYWIPCFMCWYTSCTRPTSVAGHCFNACFVLALTRPLVKYYGHRRAHFSITMNESLYLECLVAADMLHLRLQLLPLARLQLEFLAGGDASGIGR